MGLSSPALARALGLAAGMLALLALVLAGRVAEPAHASPSELFFSEYVEGSSSNKALEIFNGTGAPVTLTGAYDVQIFANGSPTASATIPLTGTVADGDVFVLAQVNAVAAVLVQADQTTSNFLFNGDDSIALRNAGTIVDVIGQIGLDPGVEWGSGDTSTADNTLRRSPGVQAGDANGADAFDPASGWAGLPIDSFDGLGAHAVSAGGGSNQAPVAAPDSVALEEDADATVDVLANDADPDGDALAVISVTEPAHGSASIEGGAVAYEPDVDYAGNDAFSYTVSDGQGGEAAATVSVTVEAVNDDPDAEDDLASGFEDASVTVDVLANDDDVDGDVLVVGAVDAPAHGVATLSADGTQLTYQPDPDFNGTDTLGYEVSDGRGGTGAAEVQVTVAPVNDPPSAAPDALAAVAGSSTVLDVTANDSPGPGDEAGQTLTVTSVGAPLHGSAEVVATGPDAGSVRYTASPGYSGADSFGYTVSDGDLTAAGLVTVAVRRPAPASICGTTPTIVGTLGDDVIEGTPGDDVIRARRGNDVIHGNGGNDVVCAGPGADTVTTGGGDDRVAGGSGADTLRTGAGRDVARGGFGKDSIEAGEGNDVVAAGFGDDAVDAGNGRNRVTGGPGDDRLVAGSGNDRIDGGAGTDTCDADGGRNTILRCE